MTIAFPLIAMLVTSAANAEDPEAPAEAAEELPIVAGPEILTYVEAPYPEDAQEQGIEGTVTLVITLDADGVVEDVDIPAPIGNGFDDAALEAVWQMEFAPARTEAGPVPVVFEFAYAFQLNEPEPPEEVVLPINLEGIVREAGTRRLLEGVQVTIEGTDLVTQSDADGSFALRGVPVGDATIKLLSPAHVTARTTLQIVEGEVSSTTFWVRAEAYRENEVVGSYQRVKDEVTRRTITIEEVRRIPGTFGDPIKVIQTLPGAARAPFGTGLLVIRGANPEDSGVYVDGIRIPIIYHLTGTTSVLQAELIESVDYLPGGYGVQYGRTMGGSIDVKTRSRFNEQGKITWGTDILDSQIFYEQQLGKNKQHGVAAGVRRSYVDVFIPLFTSGTDFTVKPRYWDYQAKYATRFDNGRSLDVFVYGFEDVLQIATPDDVAQGADQDTQGDFETRYLSHRIVGQYTHPVSEKTTLHLTPSIGYDGGKFGLGQEFSLSNATFITQLRGDLTYAPGPHLELVTGVDALSIFYGFDFRSAVRITDFDDPLAEREGIGFDGRGNGFSPDPFVRANIRPLGDDRWLLVPGLRWNALTTSQSGSIQEGERAPPYFAQALDPRVLTRVQLFEGGTLKAASGLYHQPPQPQEAVGVGAQIDTRFERAFNSSIGFEHQVTPAISWDVDFFYRKLDNLIVFDEAWTGFGTNPFINAGDGRAYGMEIIARHQPTGRFFGWVSYTLSKSERRDGPDDDWYPFDFDQTHILSAQGGYDLPYDFGISAQVQYVTGNPTSLFNAGVYDADGDFYNGFRIGDVNADRLPPFVQTSLRLDKLWTFKRWQLETYVDLLNAVRGVNPEFTLYNYDFSEYAYVRGLPFIPNVGLEARFFL